MSILFPALLHVSPLSDRSQCVVRQEFIDDAGVKDSDATRSKLRKKMNLDKELKD